MKTLTALLAACALALAAQAQSDSTRISTPDTTRIELGRSQITIISKNPKPTVVKETSRRDITNSLTWWDGFDIGVNGIMSSNYRTELPEGLSFMEPEYGRSRYVAMNFAQYKIRLINDYVGFTTGLGVQIYNFKFSGDNTLNLGDSLWSIPTGERNVSKAKLRASYLVAPALLEFNTSLNPSRCFHITAGVVGKFRLENMYKEKYRFDGADTKETVKGDLGFNRFQADALLKVGYRGVSVFGQVGLLPLFDSKNAANNADLYTFAVGLSFSFNDND